MALVTLQTLFQDAFPAYEQTHPLPAHVRRAAQAIMQGRTAALGGHIQACPDGPMARIWYNACRHRSCPPCAYLQTERWLALQRARLLACDHDHVLFTLPHALQALWLANVPRMTALLFQTVRDTFWTLLADSQYLGAQPGIMAALHTWSQTLGLHPHLPGLVTGGGLTPDGHWQAVRNGGLLPVRGVMAVFRGKRRAALRRAVDRDALVLPEAMRPQQVLNRLKRLGHGQKTPWNVRIMERYAQGAGVMTYRARSLRGGPLKNVRLVAWEGEHVIFTYRARAEEQASGTAPRSRMTLSRTALLQRGLRHVPAPQTRTVRSYGLSHHTHAEALALCRAQVGQPPVVVPVVLAWQPVCAQRGDAHPERCPACGQLLVYTALIPRGGAPPLVLPREHAA